MDNVRFDAENDDFSDFGRDGQGQFSPIIADEEELMFVAQETADLIERKGRRSLNFMEFIEEQETGFVPDCARDDIDMEILWDSESHSDHVGGMRKDDLIKLLDGRQHCQECPIKRGCLAVSMTQDQVSPNRRTEPRLPKKPGREYSRNLVMSEYLVFGGYTPQERKIIFDLIVEILQDNDDFEEEMNNKRS